MVSKLRGSLFFHATAAATAALLIAACHAREYRYVRVPVSPAEALARVERDADKAGWQKVVGKEAEYLVAAPSADANASAESGDDSQESGDDTTEAQRAQELLRNWGALYLRARAFHDDQGGSLVELTTRKAKLTSGTHPLTKSSLARPLKGEPDLWFENADVLRRQAVWNVSCATGIAVDSRYAALRLDVGAQIGYRFREWGGKGEEPSPRRGLAGTLGVGLAMQHDGVSFRPSLSLWLDSQRTVELVPGTVIPQRRKRAVELSVAPLIGTDHLGMEVGIAGHIWPWAAVFARAGYDRKPRRQRTFFFGAQTDSLGSGFVLLGLLAVGIGLALASADYDGIFGGWCHAGQCED